MKNFYLLKKKLKDNFYIKLVIVLLLLCVCALLYINQSAINFYCNGFSKIVRQPLQVYYLDVGQASSTLILLPTGETMLIDTGSEKSSEGLVKDLQWILQTNKIHKIDYLVLTHSDEDHVGGVEKLFKHFEIVTVFRPKLLARDESNLLMQYNFKIVYTDAYNNAIKTIHNADCKVNFVEDTKLQWTNFSIQFFACENLFESETNYFSPFILLECFDKNFLFTGDATSLREKEFLNQLDENDIPLNVDFLMVAHHGSKYSSSQNFLNEICPQFAFISAGDENFPAQEVVKRLQNAGTKQIFVTKTHGTIAVALNNRQFSVETCTYFVDIPLIIVIFCMASFVVIYLLSTKTDKKHRNFFKK